jgi:hypothetical protein
LCGLPHFFTSCFLVFARHIRQVFGEGRRPYRENFIVQGPVAKAKAEECSRYADEHKRRAKNRCQSAAAGRPPKCGDAISRSGRTSSGNKQARIGRGRLDAFREAPLIWRCSPHTMAMMRSQTMIQEHRPLGRRRRPNCSESRGPCSGIAFLFARTPPLNRRRQEQCKPLP